LMTRKVVFFFTFYSQRGACSVASTRGLTSIYAYQCDTVRHRIDVAE
jgi:hypothetical protein